MYDMDEFDPTRIVFTFMHDEFKKIPKRKLIAAIHRITGNERGMLQTWKNHFIGQRIPFVVTRKKETWGQTSQTVYTIWKERRV